ncbi:hypothetical protein PN441_08110 [Spirulina major CS-329]|nr:MULTISPECIES: hypothetical protein [Spirulina]MDB9496593.1 hypothetical protein [Spirulina subsalsa CS-330]MDB9503035.1 hypothetical protein [Spirulina major CS-329]
MAWPLLRSHLALGCDSIGMARVRSRLRHQLTKQVRSHPSQNKDKRSH